MKKLTEEIVRKDSSVNKVQFDKEWFYSIEDMEDYLNEDLSGVETVTLPIVIDEQEFMVKCATWEDLQRFLQKEPLEDFKGSISKKITLPSKTRKKR